MTKLTIHERREVANEVWRLFGLISPAVAIYFDENGCTIRVGFKEAMDLDVPEHSVVVGIIKGYRDYSETHYTSIRRP